MRVVRASDTAACLTAILAMVAYGLAEGAPLILLGAAPIAVAEWLWVRSKPAFQLPRAAANLLVLAAVAWAVLSALQTGVDVTQVASLIVLLLLVKLLDRRTARDAGQILTLSVFLSIGAVLTSNAFLMGVTLVVLVPLLVGATVFHQIRLGLERYVDEGGGREGAVAGRAPLAGIQRVVVVGSLGAIAVGLVVFLLMPRGIGANAFGKMSATSLGRTTSFTPTVELGRGGLISQSSAVVLDLTLRDKESDVALGGPGEVWYLRGSVLDRYDNGSWKKSEGAARKASTSKNWMPDEPLPISDGQAALIESDITIRNAASGRVPLFACWRPTTVILGQQADVSWNDHDKSLAITTEGGSIEYTVIFASDDRRIPRFTDRADVAPVRDRFIQELAVQVLRDADIDPDPATRPIANDGIAARAIESHLREEYRYTLDVLAAPGATDPVVWFLQDARTGHCEYFASAMALMCRAVGINARVITGYVATEYNPASGHYVVREGNAHAWVEIEHGVGRWRIFDPTPPDDFNRIHRSEVGIFGRLKGWFRSAEYAWINAVVAYDEQTREQLLNTTAAPAGDALQPLGRLGMRLRLAGSTTWLRALVVGIGVFAGAAAVLIVAEWLLISLSAFLRRWAASRRALRTDPTLPTRRAQMKLYDDLLAVLDRRGHPKPASTPPLAHIESIDDDPQLASLGRRIASLYYRVRFNQQVIPEQELAEARATLDEARRR